MRKYKLSSQITLAFTLTTFVAGIVFIILFEIIFSHIYKNQDELYLRNYYYEVFNDIYNKNLTEVSENVSNDKYATYYLRKTEGGHTEYDEGKKLSKILGNNYSNKINDYISTLQKQPLLKDEISGIEKRSINLTDVNNNSPIYMFLEEIKRGTKSNIILVCTDNSYSSDLRKSTTQGISFVFLSIIAIGNVLSLLWIKKIINRVNELREEVILLTNSNYSNKIDIFGNDEISDLSKEIEKMRIKIRDNEETKRNIIQNVSHDFKTPISVIVSYAEAIKDGVSDKEDCDIIIEQANKLNHKVIQLIEYNKKEYLETNTNLSPVLVKPILEEIVNMNKYKFNGKFYLNCDSSKYNIEIEPFKNAINNIIDNSIRYAESKIIINLTKKELTIFNDGAHIDSKTLNKIFTPYEKGDKGESGLGMSITKQILSHYHLQLSISNVKSGVMFTIRPL